ncbi:hypothetical protein E2C01_014641 [Portunus trituberculatus]|uniref:Uncharacterized protein n=1 Tax=Portunus trituberculatus TaxID=210409 RepID=A0A5B7DKR5_PORTR|nr:hypothetical protein [Portunus trituberculatus]
MKVTRRAVKRRWRRLDGRDREVLKRRDKSGEVTAGVMEVRWATCWVWRKWREDVGRRGWMDGQESRMAEAGNTRCQTPPAPPRPSRRPPSVKSHSLDVDTHFWVKMVS